jgi:tRNA A37 threonylcarbamoyladenosine biosynthesis protein TsaE
VDLIFGPSKVTLIEWAERFEGLLPSAYLEVQLEHVSAHRRRIRLLLHGAGWEPLVAALPAATSSPAAVAEPLMERPDAARD